MDVFNISSIGYIDQFHYIFLTASNSSSKVSIYHIVLSAMYTRVFFEKLHIEKNVCLYTPFVKFEQFILDT